MFVRSFGVTLAARLLSALLSFFIFSRVLADLNPDSAARVLFYSFVFGFCLATVRTFHLVAAGIVGTESRSKKIILLRQAAELVSWVIPLIFGAAFWILLLQGIGWQLALGGATLVVLCGHDFDLIRSSLGGQPILPLLTAGGGLLGAGLLMLGIPNSETLAATAFLVQWLPVAALQLICRRRFFPRLKNSTAVSEPLVRRLGGVVSLFLASVYDGAVLNAPYIFLVPLASTAAVDLALGSRLFVASLALFSLVSGWILTGELNKIASRFSLRPIVVFLTVQSSICVIIGFAYAAVYKLISNKDVGIVALSIFLLLVFSYLVHAAGLRFFTPRVSLGHRALVYASALMVFYLILASQYLLIAANLWVIVLSIVSALLLPSFTLSKIVTDGARQNI